MQLIDTKNAKLLGQRVRELRQEKNISLNNLAMNCSDITSATWSRMENGKNDIKFSSLIKVAAALDINLSELLKDVPFIYTFNED